MAGTELRKGPATLLAVLVLLLMCSVGLFFREEQQVEEVAEHQVEEHELDAAEAAAAVLESPVVEETVPEAAPAPDDDVVESDASPDPSPAGVAGRTTPAEGAACGCPVGVLDADVHPEGPWWTRAPVEFPDGENLKDSLARVAVDGTVFVMMVNEGELDLLDNFLCSLRVVGVNKYIVFATDDAAYNALGERGYHRFRGVGILPKLDRKDASFNSMAWKRLTQAKLLIAEQVLALGFNVFLSDVDIVWLENVMPGIVAGTKPAYWLMDYDEKDKKQNKEANTGFYLLRAGKPASQLIKSALDYRKKQPLWDDQKLLNQVMPGRLKTYLPRPRFVNGCYLRNNKGKDLVQAGVAAIHVNCCPNKLAKHARMCQFGLWFCSKPPAGAKGRCSSAAIPPPDGVLPLPAADASA